VSGSDIIVFVFVILFYRICINLVCILFKFDLKGLPD
jgi:hypothetical protein